MTQPSASRDIWVLLATILASSMAFIDSTAIRVALPVLQRELNIAGADLFWIDNAYLLFLASLILVGGSLGDRYGRNRVFGIGILIFTAASAVCGLASSSGMLIAARAVQGIGGALMIPGSLAIISASFPPDRRGAAIGTWSMFTTVTSIIGPFLGGWLVDQGLWRVIFFVNVPLAAIALWALVTRVPESRDPNATGRLDYAGVALTIIGLAGLAYGFIEMPSLGLANPQVALALLVGVVALIAFVLVELRIANPMIPPRLFRSRTFTGTNALTFFLYGGLYGALFFLPLNLQQVQGYTALQAGLSNLPSAVLLTILSRFAGSWVDRFGARLPLVIGPTIAGIAFLLYALPGITGGANDFWTTFFPGTVAFGIGMGITVAPLVTAVMGSAPAESSGIASGVNNAISRIANVLAVAILGAIALTAFSSNLDSRAASLDLPAESADALRAEAPRLADAQPPDTLTEEQAAAAQDAIRWAFVDTFRLLMLIGAGLAFISAGLAALLVEGKQRVPA
jgi:EmrB/QacA subfamily drug resistance transporter